jgi:hypothetical protein
MLSDIGKEVAYDDALKIIKKHRLNLLLYKCVLDNGLYMRVSDVENAFDQIEEEVNKEIEAL